MNYYSATTNDGERNAFGEIYRRKLEEMFEGMVMTQPEPRRVPTLGTEPQVALSPCADGMVEQDEPTLAMDHQVNVVSQSRLIVLSSPDRELSGNAELEFLKEHFVSYEIEALKRSSSDASRVLRAAKGLLAIGDAAEALRILAPLRHSHDYWILHSYALALGRLHRWEEAETALRQLATERQSDPRPLHALGRLLMQQGKFADARQVLEQACEKADADPLTFNDDAVAAMNCNDFRGAMKLLRSALRIDESCTVALNNTAVCYQVMGLGRKAKRFYLAALHADPDCVSAVHNIAEAYILERDFSAAIELLDNFRKRHPVDTRALERLAWAHACLGSRERAISLLREAVQISGEKDPSLLNNLGVALCAKGRFDLAQSAYRKALQLDGSSLIFRLNYAYLFAAKEKWEGVLELLPPQADVLANVDALLLRCASLVHSGSCEEATSELLGAREIFPDDPRLIVWLGFLLASRVDDLDGAVRLLTDAIKKHPADLGIVNNLAYALIKQNRIAEARAVLEPHRSEVEMPSSPLGVLLRATWGLLRIREDAFEEGMRSYGLAKKQARGSLVDRIEEKMLVERGRYMLGHGKARDAREVLKRARVLNADVEFNLEAEELLEFCGTQGLA